MRAIVISDFRDKETKVIHRANGPAIELTKKRFKELTEAPGGPFVVEYKDPLLDPPKAPGTGDGTGNAPGGDGSGAGDGSGDGTNDEGGDTDD